MAAATSLADGKDAPVPDACAVVVVSAWHGSANVTVDPQGTLMHLAPVIGSIALLGEAGKVSEPFDYLNFDSACC
jgi:hypothetical protein